MGWIADLLKEIPSAARYKSELEAMEKQNVSLKSEVAELRQEIQRRDNVVKEQESHGQRLEELREKILVLVAQNERLHDARVAALAGVTKQLATLHLHELRDAKFVRSTFGLDEHSYQVDVWFVEQPGRKYLANHGLL
ncbi:MAG: hypothetical protein ACK4N4_06735 [Burkholderiales bacterium]